MAKKKNDEPKAAGRKSKATYTMDSLDELKPVKTSTKKFKVAAMCNGKVTAEDVAKELGMTVKAVMSTLRAVRRQHGYGFEVKNFKIRMLDNFKKECLAAHKASASVLD